MEWIAYTASSEPWRVQLLGSAGASPWAGEFGLIV